MKAEEALGIFLGYRKFIVMLILLTIGITFRIENLIDGAQMVDLLKEVAIVFVGGNAAEHAANVAKSWITVKHKAEAATRPDNPDA